MNRTEAKKIRKRISTQDGKPFSRIEAEAVFLSPGMFGLGIIPKPPQLVGKQLDPRQKREAYLTASVARFIAHSSGFPPGAQELLGLITAAFLAAALVTEGDTLLKVIAGGFLISFWVLVVIERKAARVAQYGALWEKAADESPPRPATPSYARRSFMMLAAASTTGYIARKRARRRQKRSRLAHTSTTQRNSGR